MSEFIDGHRWPQHAVPPRCSCGKPFPEDGGKEGVCECCSTCVPSSEVSAASTPSLISTSEDEAPADFPTFDVYAGFLMRPDTIALHFPLTAVPALCALFPTEAGKIHAAALLVEQEAEWDADRIRGRQLTGGGA